MSGVCGCVCGRVCGWAVVVVMVVDRWFTCACECVFCGCVRRGSKEEEENEADGMVQGEAACGLVACGAPPRASQETAGPQVCVCVYSCVCVCMRERDREGVCVSKCACVWAGECVDG